MENDTSQFGEGQWLLDLLKFRESGLFVDIGGLDGLSGSNTRMFANKGWPGLIIEPNPVSFQMLAKEYAGLPHVALLRAAVGNKQQLVSFYAFEDMGLCTTLEEQKDAFVAVGKPQPNVFFVPQYSIEQIVLMCGEQIALLSVDTEGKDAEIMLSFPFHLQRPEVIVCEIDKSTWTAKASDHIVEQGYVKVFSNSCNSIWKRQD